MLAKPIVIAVKGVITIPKRTLTSCIFTMKTAYFILKELHSIKESDIYSEKPTLQDVNSVI